MKENTRSNKKIILLVIIAVLLYATLLFLMSTHEEWFYWIPGNYYPYPDIRPETHYNTIWRSEDPDIYFLVPPSTGKEPDLRGELILDGEKYEIGVYMGRTTIMRIWVFDDKYRTETGVGISGECTFKEDRVIVKVDKESDIVFNGKYSEITFYKSDYEEVKNNAPLQE